MPQVEGAPKGLNDILESAYQSALKKYPGNKGKAAKIAWGAVKNAGWSKNKDGKWVKKKKEMADVTAKDLVIFKAGHWNGETFTEEDLDNMVKSFNTEEGIPIIIGHSSDYKGHTRIPAFGRILGGLKRIGQDLIASGVQFNDKLAHWIQEGFYNKRSIELTRDNKKVLAVGMLGAVPPAVTGLPGNDEALNEVALQFAAMSDAKVIEFAQTDDGQTSADGGAVDEVEAIGTDDTVKDITEYCANFISLVEDNLNADVDAETCKQRINLAAYDLQSEIQECLSMHFMFIDKLENIEEHQESEMSEKKNWLAQLAGKIIHKQKESAMDKEKEETYQNKIVALETQNQEFAEKERLANEAKVKAAKDAEEIARVTEVKTFCDAAIKENRMSPAMREADEKIMLELAKVSPDALKSFREKYAKPIVPLGVTVEVDANDPNDKRPQVIVSAEKYVQANPKEFSGLTPDQALSRAIFLHSIGQIKFEGGQTILKGA